MYVPISHAVLGLSFGKGGSGSLLQMDSNGAPLETGVSEEYSKDKRTNTAFPYIPLLMTGNMYGHDVLYRDLFSSSPSS